MKYWRGCLVSRVALMRVTIQLNIFSYTALASAPVAYATCEIRETTKRVVPWRRTGRKAAYPAMPDSPSSPVTFLEVTHLLDILPLGDVLIAHFHPGVAQPLEQVSRVQPHEVGRLVGLWKQRADGTVGMEVATVQQPWPLGIHSCPTSHWHPHAPPSVPSGSACSSRCFCLNFMFPKCMMAPVSL